MTHCFVTNPSCNSTTDRRTVSTPQRHLPSVPTLTLTHFFMELSLPGPTLELLLTTMSTTPSGLVSPDTPSGLAPAPEASTPMPGHLTSSPHLSPPLLLPPFPLYGNMSLQY